METGTVEAVVAIAGMPKGRRATVALTPRVLGAINDGKLRLIDPPAAVPTDSDAAGEPAEGSRTDSTADDQVDEADPAKPAKAPRAQRSRKPRA